MNRTQYPTIRDTILESPGASYWLKDAIQALDKRDPCDAANDAQTLLLLCNARL